MAERLTPDVTRERARKIMEERTPSPEQVIFDPTVEFLDPEHKLTREEMGRIIATGDRTAISYRNLADKVIRERGQTTTLEGEEMEATTAFYLQYALAARSQNEISHTSILEQMNAGPEEMNGDPPITFEGVSILTGLRDICALRHFGFEAFSSRGGIFPEGYWRIPNELENAGIGIELRAINREIYQIYLELTRRGIEHSLQTLPKREGERDWQFRWRVLNVALDDARQVTNQSFLNHFSMHPNSALALREGIVKLASSPLPETVELANKLRELATKGLPTLMRFTEASPYQQSLPERKREMWQQFWNGKYADNLVEGPGKTELVRDDAGEPIIRISPERDAVVEFLAAFLSNGNPISRRAARGMLTKQSRDETIEIVNSIFEGMTLHDKPPAELEIIQIQADFRFSVGAIYELVRHRPAVHDVAGFSPNFGYTMPAVYEELRLGQAYANAMVLNERGYHLIAGLGDKYRDVFGPYFVARGHLQPVTLNMSALEAFHMLKIRADAGAHPDIRGPMFELEKALKEACPAIFNNLVKRG